MRSVGFTLVEVLVALLLLCVGMLAVATLFTSHLSNNRGALLLTQAVLLVSDMADRIRANAGELAEEERAQWLAEVHSTLPWSPDPPLANVELLGGDPRRFRVSVEWREPGFSDPLSLASEMLVRSAP